MYKIGEDEMMQCPYNRYHIISKLRIQKHLVKCKKNHPEIKLATCFYNYTHRLKPEAMLEHYEVCPYKARVEGARYYETDNNSCSSSMKSNQEIISFAGSLKSLSLWKRRGKQSGTHSMSNRNFNISNKSLEILDEEYCAKLNDLSLDKEDDELEPLPLPKTTSKAFINAAQDSINLSSLGSSQIKSFGRGKNILHESTPKLPRSTDHLLPDLSDVQSDQSKRVMASKFFAKNMNISCSELSEVLDDCTTLNSEEIIFNKDDDYGFFLKDFDKYRKI